MRKALMIPVSAVLRSAAAVSFSTPAMAGSLSQPPVDHPVGGNPDGIVAADLNGDGKRDLAVANHTNAGRVSILLATSAQPVVPDVPDLLVPALGLAALALALPRIARRRLNS
jgi:hypothetical protein